MYMQYIHDSAYRSSRSEIQLGLQTEQKDEQEKLSVFYI
jgi:hypothetical protein